MMKKMVLALMVLALAAFSFTAFAEEPVVQEAPNPDLYSGIWECDRATAEIVWEEEGYRVMIHWGSSAWEDTTWEYSCFYHEDDKTLVSMPFGIRTEWLFNDNGENVSATAVYEDGQATFSIDEDGYLIWLDEKENAGDGMRFEWISEYPIEEEIENG